MTDNEDLKERMRQALEKKKKRPTAKPGSGGPGQARGQEHADREGGKREFRRKSG